MPHELLRTLCSPDTWYPNHPNDWHHCQTCMGVMRLSDMVVFPKVQKDGEGYRLVFTPYCSLEHMMEREGDVH